MRGTAECPDVLFARSRRGPLSPVERRALDAHLAVCGSCRAAMLLATLYDDVPDETEEAAQACAVRLANRVVIKRDGRARPSRFLSVALAAAVLVVAGVAAAWVAVRRPRPAVHHEPPVASPPRQATGSRGSAFRPRPDLLGDAPPVDGEAAPSTPAAPSPLAPAAAAADPMPRLPAPFEPRPFRRRAAPPPTPSAPAKAPVPLEAPPSPAEGPGDLFAAANAARLARELPEAVERYRLLQDRFPISDEARLSFFSAGDVLQRLGQPDRALAEFNRYLDVQPAGSLASDALFGRARCLDALGRHNEAVDAWERLLRDFPNSIYESAARRRLAELAR